MTRIELIHEIGDLITKIDILRGSLPQDDPNRLALDSLRTTLDSKQAFLVGTQFDLNTEQFKDSTTALVLVNSNLREAIKTIDRVNETVEMISQVTAIIDGIIKIIL